MTSTPPINKPRPLSHEAHRDWIGLFGLLLPLILFLLAGVRPTPGLPRWATLDSISVYYYTGATAFFTGLLFALAGFLFTYRGYENDVADRRAGKVGGVRRHVGRDFPNLPTCQCARTCLV